MKLAPMKLGFPTQARQRTKPAAFTLIEVVIAVAIMAVMLVSLYGGMSATFARTQASRENLRATQIILERMEGIRLHTWDQLAYSNWIPTTFSNWYYPSVGGNVSKGTLYTGTMVITNANLNPSATYTSDMKQVTVTLSWTNYYGYNKTQPIAHTRTMTTYVGKWGMQNYIFSN